MILRVKQFEKKDFSIRDIIFVPYRDFYLVVNTNEIIYIKAEKSYCRIILKCGKEYLLISSLGILLNKLPDYFIRIHRSYVLNLCHAHSIHNGKIVRLKNDDEIPISRRKKKCFFELVAVC